MEYTPVYLKCKEFRQFLGISRKKFAEMNNLTFAQVYHFERGESKNMDILMAYIDLGLDINC